MSIGERISELRKQQNLSQGQLATALEISRQAVSKWENDQAVPDALKMIHLAQILDTDIEYLSTGRRSYGRRPPVVITQVKEIEKLVEKPVIQVKTVEKRVEVPVVVYVEKPVLKTVYRTQYRREPMELLLVAIGSFLLGLAFGALLL